jgi:hypothetical protein
VSCFIYQHPALAISATVLFTLLAVGLVGLLVLASRPRRTTAGYHRKIDDIYDRAEERVWRSL